MRLRSFQRSDTDTNASHTCSELAYAISRTTAADTDVTHTCSDMFKTTIFTKNSDMEKQNGKPLNLLTPASCSSAGWPLAYLCPSAVLGCLHGCLFFLRFFLWPLGFLRPPFGCLLAAFPAAYRLLPWMLLRLLLAASSAAFSAAFSAASSAASSAAVTGRLPFGYLLATFCCRCLVHFSAAFRLPFVFGCPAAISPTPWCA